MREKTHRIIQSKFFVTKLVVLHKWDISNKVENTKIENTNGFPITKLTDAYTWDTPYEEKGIRIFIHRQH